MSYDHETLTRFIDLFTGRQDAYGLDRGGIVRQRVTRRMYLDHIEGRDAIGVFPLLDNGTCHFAAIDLDEPNFELAHSLTDYIPGGTWVEESRSGNAHVWLFFDAPCPAWAARGYLRDVLKAVERPEVEIFPKQAELRPGMVGNYINLPCFGAERPIFWKKDTAHANPYDATGLASAFGRDDIEPHICAERIINGARARGVTPPSEREDSEWGTRRSPHRCATYMLEHMHDNPIVPGHRNVVFFNLAKMLLNCEQYDFDETVELVDRFNQAGTDPVRRSEVRSICRNAEAGEYTSTGCDDPLMAPYVSPECEIAHG